MRCSAGASPAFLRYMEIGKIAGETPALRNPSSLRNQNWAHILRLLIAYMAGTHPRGIIPNAFVSRYTSP